MTADGERRFDVAVIGAGIAGLCATRELAAAGLEVIVLDKARGVGGRMATRLLADAVLDHGAQFFTVRGADFAGLVEAAATAGRVARWCDGFSRAAGVEGPVVPATDGHARWRGAQAMTDLPKLLAAEVNVGGAEVRTQARVVGVATDGERVRLEIEDAAPLAVRGCVVTTPVPQALDLFAAGGFLTDSAGGIAADARRMLATVAYDPCFALMLVLDRPSGVPAPGGIQFESGPISWLADNHLKGISPQPALTVHASAEFSRARFDDPPAEVARTLRELAAPWIGAAAVVEQSLQRWKFATPTVVLGTPFVVASGTPPIVCCGDAFAGPKVEGAAASGLAAGRWLRGVLAGA